MSDRLARVIDELGARFVERVSTKTTLRGAAVRAAQESDVRRAADSLYADFLGEQGHETEPQHSRTVGADLDGHPVSPATWRVLLMAALSEHHLDDILPLPASIREHQLQSAAAVLDLDAEELRSFYLAWHSGLRKRHYEHNA